MPQLAVLALFGAGLYAGYKVLTRVSGQIAAELKRAEQELKRRAEGSPAAKDLGRLEFDPRSGVYKPARRT